ncbi:hypothetical protein BKA62DRAFT_457299 [Auriculariales sp. MPI-PUGE-AT-0066]|nr:hypothetical protein BKA62DRAFT_457299 [Auriculariales sp. MPI-PUGE-AT-0066]
MLQQSATSNAIEGTETHPLHVPRVSEETLADLLEILYGGAGTTISLHAPRLIYVLRAAHRYQFERIITAIVSTLVARPDQEISPLRKLAISLSCPGNAEFREWSIPALHSVVQDFSIDKIANDHERLLTADMLEMLRETRGMVVNARREYLVTHELAIRNSTRGSRTLAPQDQFELVKQVVLSYSRTEWAAKGVSLRLARQPHARSFSSTISDVTQEFLEECAPPLSDERAIVELALQRYLEKQNM